MKPIMLSVAGLNSFREQQDIDFASLCEAGLFGIFGPTGSGKSSLLDAMTLALYGKVERAANNTQGIMNHAENELYVSLLFELSHATGQKRYKVERKLKRNDDIRLKTTTCRLIDLSNEPVVLADKMNEVNDQVQHLLGLTIDDFSRAVVLPQGKFAEFLSLKGIDRRKMLQRLFNLEKYGDVLNERIRTNINAVKADLNAVLNEQIGLGEASDEALKIAEQKVNQAEAILKTNEIELGKLEKQFESAKQIWHLQQSLIEIQAEQQLLDKQKSVMTSKQTSLEKAMIADQLKPVLDAYLEAGLQKEQLEAKLKSIETATEETSERYQAAVKQYEQAKTARVANEKRLIVQIERLEQARQVEIELTELTKKHGKLNEEVSQIQTELAANQTQLDHQVELKNKALDKQKQLQEQLASLEVSWKEREKISKASDMRRDLTLLTKSHAELLKDKNEHELAWAKLHEAEAAKHKQLTDAAKDLESLFRRTEKCFAHVCGRERDLEALQDMLHFFQEKGKKQLEAEQVKVIADQLVKSLKPGEPCPVCGAIDHTEAVKSHEVKTGEAETFLKQIEDKFTVMNKAKQDLATLKMYLEQISAGITALLPETIVHVTSKIAEPLTNQQTGKDSWEHCLAECSTFAIELKSLRQDCLALQETYQHSQKLYQSTKQEYQNKAYEQKLMGERLHEVNNKYGQLTEQLRTAQLEWNSSFPDLDMQALETEQKLLQQKDEKAAEVKERLAKSWPFIEEKEQAITALQENIRQKQVSQAQLETTFKQLTDRIAEKQAYIGSLAKEEQIDVQYNRVTQDLRLLQQNEQQTYELLETSQTKLLDNEKLRSAVVQAEADAKLRYEKTETNWANKLEQSCFHNQDEVETNSLKIEIQTELKMEIEQYNEDVRTVRIESEKIKAELNGATITVEKWQEIQDKRARKQQLVSQNREEKGAAIEILKEINRKHGRYNELNKVKQTLEKEVDKLSKLQQVMRGNAFVEFIAEEQLHQVSLDASERLKQLTRNRYALEVDSGGGFMIRDDANGGIRRPVSTLSGGETFLTSLALALALSSQIQLRGQYPLEFFFLDEGFGTLDQDLLDTVITSLEKLRTDRLAVGVISHVQELRARLSRKLIVDPAEPSGRGSTVKIEML